MDEKEEKRKTNERRKYLSWGDVSIFRSNLGSPDTAPGLPELTQQIQCTCFPLSVK